MDPMSNGFVAAEDVAAWQQLVAEARAADDSRPTLDRQAALRGVAGNVVKTLEPHTEADPVALLVTFLSAFGSAVGSGPHAWADGSEHPARLNPLLVGRTGSGSRKGSSEAQVRRVMQGADPVWYDECRASGLSSGEGLVAALQNRDDRRLMVAEAEFARVLAVMRREGNTLSTIIRDAWDGRPMRVMTRNRPLHVDNHHITILAHITPEELALRLNDAEVANGFANRFLFVWVERARLLPEGGALSGNDLAALQGAVSRTLRRARKLRRLRRDDAARERWAVLYAEMADRQPGGMYGAAVGRAEAQVLRLSVAYALLDGSELIRVPHLEAAWAVWRYCDASARRLFSGMVGDSVADRLLQAIRQRGELSFEEQRDLFGRNVPAADLAAARDLLEGRGLIENLKVPTRGRPRQVSRGK